MVASRAHASGGVVGNRTMTTTTLIAAISLILSSRLVSSFLLPRQLPIHQPPIRTSISPISSNGSQLPTSMLSSVQLYQSPKSKDGGKTSTTSKSAEAEEGTSKRAKLKAAQRAKKQRQQQQTTNINKATSQHPEAIIKRQNQKQQGNNKRRNHNFAQRAEFLREGTAPEEDYGFDDDLDQLTLTIHKDNSENNNNGDNNGDNSNGKTNNIQNHQLHSRRVSKLDASTTADDVVKAIKRAQNLHDVHDIVEIAHFLLEEVGKSPTYCIVLYCIFVLIFCILGTSPLC